MSYSRTTQGIASFFEAMSRCIVVYDRRTNDHYQVKHLTLTAPNSQDNVYARLSKMRNVFCDEAYPVKCGNAYIVTYYKRCYPIFKPATRFYL